MQPGDKVTRRSRCSYVVIDEMGPGYIKGVQWSWKKPLGWIKQDKQPKIWSIEGWKKFENVEDLRTINFAEYPHNSLEAMNECRRGVGLSTINRNTFVWFKKL